MYGDQIRNCHIVFSTVLGGTAEDDAIDPDCPLGRYSKSLQRLLSEFYCIQGTFDIDIFVSFRNSLTLAF